MNSTAQPRASSSLVTFSPVVRFRPQIANFLQPFSAKKTEKQNSVKAHKPSPNPKSMFLVNVSLLLVVPKDKEEISLFALLKMVAKN